MADGRQRKKVRFADGDGSHHIGGRHVANICEVAKSKPQVCDAKTAEYKFFKKLCEQSGHSSRSYKHYHQSTEPKITRQKQDSHNVTPLRKFSIQRNTVCCDDPPGTPAKNEEISDKQVNVQSSHSEYGDKDTPQFNPHDYLPNTCVFTPIAQTSFEVSGFSKNPDREPVSGRIFSEKRSKLLKLAAKTVSMGIAELLQRRSEFVCDILQRLGTNNIIRKHHEGSVRHSKIDCRKAPAIPQSRYDNLLNYKETGFNSLTTLRRMSQKPSSCATDEACRFMALPCGHSQSRPSFIDWKNHLPHGGNEARECLALPWVCNDISSCDQKRGIVHNKLSNLLLEDVEPYIHVRSASADELSLNVQTASCDQNGWGPMLSVTLAESFRDRLCFPCQVEEQHAVPFAISNTSWQPDLCRSIQQCVPSSVGLESEDPKEVGLCDNYGAGFSTWFDQLLAKSTASSFVDSGNEIMDHNGFRYISNFHVSRTNDMSCLSSMCCTPEHPFELGPKSLHGSHVGISYLSGLEEKYSTEVELSDRLLQVLDQLPVKFTPSSFSNDSSRIWDQRHLRYLTSSPTNDSSSTLCLDANDSGLNSLCSLNSLSSYSEHPCKQAWNSLHDSSTELWSQAHQLQSHANLGAVLGLMSNESAYSDLGGHHSLMLLQSNLNNDVLGTTDLSFFGSCSDMDNITEAPMSSDAITW